MCKCIARNAVWWCASEFALSIVSLGGAIIPVGLNVIKGSFLSVFEFITILIFLVAIGISLVGIFATRKQDKFLLVLTIVFNFVMCLVNLAAIVACGIGLSKYKNIPLFRIVIPCLMSLLAVQLIVYVGCVLSVKKFREQVTGEVAKPWSFFS